MTIRYTHASGLDLHEREGFSLWSDAHGDTLTYPRGWFLSAAPEEISALGFTRIVTPAPAPTPLDPLTIPLTRRQLRLGLLHLGRTKDAVDAAIAAIADPIQREQARIVWEDSGEYNRNHPLFDTLPAALGITADQIDAEWALAVAY